MVGRFRPGDRVRESEGGPIMHVKEYDPKGRVVCSWYITKEGWQRQSFDEAGLQRVGKSRSPSPS